MLEQQTWAPSPEWFDLLDEEQVKRGVEREEAQESEEPTDVEELEILEPLIEEPEEARPATRPSRPGQTVIERPVSLGASKIPQLDGLMIVRGTPADEVVAGEETPTPLVPVYLPPVLFHDDPPASPKPPVTPPAKKTPTLPSFPIIVREKTSMNVVGAQLLPAPSRYAIAIFTLTAAVLYTFEQVAIGYGAARDTASWIRAAGLAIIAVSLAIPHMRARPAWSTIRSELIEDVRAYRVLVVALAFGVLLGANAPAAARAMAPAAFVVTVLAEELFFRLYFARSLRSDGSRIAVPVAVSAVAYGVLLASAFGLGALAFGVLAGAVFALFQHYTGRAAAAVVCHVAAAAVMLGGW